MKKFITRLIIIIAILIIGLYLTGTDYILKAVQTVYLQGNTTASIDDYTFFENKTINIGKSKAWPLHKNYNKTPATEKLLELHKSQGTVAYLIIKNDSILFESYYDGYNEDSKSNSFSMAKSYVSGLLGKAIMDGYIKSIDQPVSDFFPQYKEGLGAKVTVGDLASMASGSSWKESYYSPFTITTRAYFGTELEKAILGLTTVEVPGKSFKYASGDTQLLAMVIEKATGKKLYNYLSESFWAPLESENQALWQIDSETNDMVKAYCCVASNAKDFARFGKLYKDHGKWNGQQVLDSAFVAKSVRPRFKESPKYGYGWWLRKTEDKSFFMMEGHLGQCVVVEPNDNLIVVRLGNAKASSGNDPYNGDISTYIEEAYKMLSHAPKTQP
jgi:CubicO group peptidase (beta-lactamase class C family)